METYHKSVLEYRDVQSCIELADERGFAKGVKSGMERGAISKSYEIARNLLKRKYPIVDIAEATGLTLEQVINL